MSILEWSTEERALDRETIYRHIHNCQTWPSSRSKNQKLVYGFRGRFDMCNIRYIQFNESLYNIHATPQVVTIVVLEGENAIKYGELLALLVFDFDTLENNRNPCAA